jgi:alkylation response protein AidB-like acyl-CoA dehydrogenase
VLERALNTPYTYFTILCDELAAASMGFAATVCMHGSTATHTPSFFKWGVGELKQRYLVPAIKRGEDLRLNGT